MTLMVRDDSSAARSRLHITHNRDGRNWFLWAARFGFLSLLLLTGCSPGMKPSELIGNWQVDESARLPKPREGLPERCRSFAIALAANGTFTATNLPPEVFPHASLGPAVLTNGQHGNWSLNRSAHHYDFVVLDFTSLGDNFKKTALPRRVRGTIVVSLTTDEISTKAGPLSDLFLTKQK
jgi:hypothetical protein